MFCPVFTVTLIYKPILKSIRPKLFILSPLILQKITRMAISQKPTLPKCHSPKSLLLLHSSMNLSWSIFDLGLQKILSPKYFFLKRGLILDFGLKNWPQLVCAKSIFTLILKVSDKFIEKCRRSRLFGE